MKFSSFGDLAAEFVHSWCKVKVNLSIFRSWWHIGWADV